MKTEKAKSGRRMPYEHRVIECGILPEIQEEAGAIAVGVKDLQNTAIYAILLAMMAHEYSNTDKAPILGVQTTP